MLVFEKFSGESVCILVLHRETNCSEIMDKCVEVNQTSFNIYLKYFNGYIHNGM